MIKECTHVEIAIQNTKSEISLDLIYYKADYGAWMTWNAFSTYIKNTYGLSELDYT